MLRVKVVKVLVSAMEVLANKEAEAVIDPEGLPLAQVHPVFQQEAVAVVTADW